SQHAIAAADALVRVVGDRSVGLPVEGGRRAGRNARGLQAVEAPAHDEGVAHPLRRLLVGSLVEGDECVGPGGERGRVLEAELGFALCALACGFVPLLAGDLAGAAADAVGDVDERRLDGDAGFRSAHARLPSGFRAAPGGAEPFSTLTRQALVSWVPAP